ncbi:MAG TPA: universal stress protein [Noviherbaspirillum sp.]
MQKVLFAYDGSVQARKAVECFSWWPAESLEVIVLTAVKGPALNEMGDAVDIDPDTRARAEGRLSEVQTLLREKGIACLCRITAGDPRDVIIETAMSEPFDLIVIGSRGLNFASRMLLGSVSTEVAQRAPCPVLLVH